MDPPIPHKSSPLVQNPTTQGQYDIVECRCAQCQLILQSPTQIEPKCTKPYYTGQYNITECRHTQCQSTPQPLPIEPGATETYYNRRV